MLTTMAALGNAAESAKRVGTAPSGALLVVRRLAGTGAHPDLLPAATGSRFEGEPVMAEFGPAGVALVAFIGSVSAILAVYGIVRGARPRR